MQHCLISSQKPRPVPIGFLIIMVLALSLLFSPSLRAEERDQSTEPITITADRLETYEGGRVIVFSGRVKAHQGDMTVDSDTLRIKYAPGSDRGEMTPDRGIEEIVAEGSVTIEGETFIVTGDHALLNYEDQIMIVTGDRAVLKEGDNIVEGDRITWYMAEERGIVEDKKRGRVTATIQPAAE